MLPCEKLVDLLETTLERAGPKTVKAALQRRVAVRYHQHGHGELESLGKP